MNSEQLHVVERFALDPDKMTITRSYTADDPVNFTDQFTGSDTIGVADLPYAPDTCKELTSFVDPAQQGAAPRRRPGARCRSAGARPRRPRRRPRSRGGSSGSGSTERRLGLLGGSVMSLLRTLGVLVLAAAGAASRRRADGCADSRRRARSGPSRTPCCAIRTPATGSCGAAPGTAGATARSMQIDKRNVGKLKQVWAHEHRQGHPGGDADRPRRRDVRAEPRRLHPGLRREDRRRRCGSTNASTPKA